MENNVKERLIKYVQYKKMSKSEFCRAINVSNAFITSIRESIQPDKIKSIALNFPDLNIVWLMTGSGEMLNQTEEKAHNSDAPCLQCAIKDAEIARLKDKIIELQERLLNGVEPKKVQNAG